MSGPPRRGGNRNVSAPNAQSNAQAEGKPRAPRPPRVDPYEHLPPFPPHDSLPRVYYARTVADADRVAAYLVKTGGPIGFDVEWRPNYVAGLADNRIALVQVASRHVVLLAQVIHMPEFPPVLKDLLESRDIAKTGAGIQGDAVKMYNDYGVVLRNCIDVASLALTLDPMRWEAPPPPPKPETPVSETQGASATIPRSNGYSRSAGKKGPDGRNRPPREPRPPRDPNAPPPLSTPGLASLTGKYMQLHLDKPKKVQRSNWEFVLSAEQQQYAANDATAGYEIYKSLKSLAATLTRPKEPDARSPQFFSFDVYAGNVFFRVDDAYGVDATLERPADALDSLPLPPPITLNASTGVSYPATEARVALPVPQPDVFPRLAKTVTTTATAAHGTSWASRASAGRGAQGGGSGALSGNTALGVAQNPLQGSRPHQGGRGAGRVVNTGTTGTSGGSKRQ